MSKYDGKFSCPDIDCEYYVKHKILPMVTEMGFVPPFCKLGFCKHQED